MTAARSTRRAPTRKFASRAVVESEDEEVVVPKKRKANAKVGESSKAGAKRKRFGDGSDVEEVDDSLVFDRTRLDDSDEDDKEERVRRLRRELFCAKDMWKFYGRTVGVLEEQIREITRK
jgi:hypothetical protein